MSGPHNIERTLGEILGEVRTMREELRRAYERMNDHDRRLNSVETHQKALWLAFGGAFIAVIITKARALFGG